MKMRLNRRGMYFDTYHIYDENEIKVGIIEDHNRDVKSQYFVGWKLTPSGSTWETEVFDTIDEAIIYSVGVIVSDYR